ncbi:glycosyltransferase family 25 protein [Brucella endophytica]|uniref:glycosyltransferase family 25 protein n=1 Tax=Brucella endophytica TaxID=1963359 RepID=UPI00166746FE|nr:glycosyltransferase family 25 protein [Brucella endophytica]
MQCYVINLDRSADRLDAIARSFNRIELGFERVSAIDAREFAPGYLAALTSNDRLAAETVACFLSHQKCWQKLLESNDPYAAIFEDDIIFSAEAGLILADPCWLPEGFDLIKLETFQRNTIIDKVMGAVIPGYHISRLLQSHVGAGGYVLSRECAAILIQQTQEVAVPVDHFLFKPGSGPFETMNIYQLTPAICIQRCFVDENAPESLIERERKKTEFVKPSGLRKLGREIVRPFKKMKIKANGLFMNLFTTKRWGKIPFRA